MLGLLLLGLTSMTVATVAASVELMPIRPTPATRAAALHGQQQPLAAGLGGHGSARQQH